MLRALLQTIANPQQDVPLIATLASPVFGFSADDLAAFRCRQKQSSVYDALCADNSPKAVAFLETLAALRREARLNTLAQLIEKIFLLTRMDSIYAAMDSGKTRRGNLQEFYRIAADFEATSRRELSQFLEHLDALEEQGLATATDGTGGAVTIMSIHKSKGLEFPVIFLCSLAREFNRDSTRAQVLCDKELGLGLSVADTKNRIRYPALSKRAIVAKTVSESLSEEMRVLYVAMTRPKDRLIMTYAPKNLKADIQDLALRYDISGAELLTKDASCLGQWILLSAISRTEAGEFHALGGRPAQTKVSEYPWLIRVIEVPKPEKAGMAVQTEERKLPKAPVEHLRQTLGFSYPHSAATAAPSKMTATQRKGRIKDQEAAENAEQLRAKPRSWRKPSFISEKVEGKIYGSAIHSVMQYICYEKCTDVEAVELQIKELSDRGFVTAEAAAMANRSHILSFFETKIGQKLRDGTAYVREFKFSILDDGENYGEGLQGEQVLLQGVVDCAMIEEDGITIIDFKTDYVTEETLPDFVEHYRLQVQTYAQAMSRIYAMPIKGAYLYFFRLNRFVPI